MSKIEMVPSCKINRKSWFGSFGVSNEIMLCMSEMFIAISQTECEDTDMGGFLRWLPYWQRRYQYIRAKTTWLPYCRQHFQMHFLEWKSKNFDHNFTKVYSWRSSWQWTCIGSDNGFNLNRHQWKKVLSRKYIWKLHRWSLGMDK